MRIIGTSRTTSRIRPRRAERPAIYNETPFMRHGLHFVLVVAGVLMLPHGPTFALAKNAPDVLRELSSATARVAREATPAVVGIWVDIKAGAEQTSMMSSRDEMQGYGQTANLAALPGQNDLSDSQRPGGPSPRQFPQLQEHEQALGSGFIVSRDGYIITNNHVVGEADLVLVTIGDNEPVRAQVVGTDPATDLAVIRVRGRNDLPVLPFGDSDRLEVGDWVIAIGQPFGLSHTTTSGIVSALGRSNIDLTRYEDFIQTDAAINPGNSGGPLVNLDGQVVGVNTAILGPHGNIGIGFAIPINLVKNVYEQIRKNGKVIRGFIGVNIQDLTPELVTAFGLPDNTKGVLISHVTASSPAEAAGLEPGDIIVQFDGKSVAGVASFQTQVSTFQPGTRVPLVVLRNGAKQNLTIKLGTRLKATPAKSTQRPTLEVAGMAVQNLNQDLAERLGYQGQKGVVIVAVAPDSVAGFSGLGPGMLIQQIDHQGVQDIKEFESVLKEAAQKPPVLLLVNNQGAYRYLVLAVPQS
jgi:serine protease Do